MFQYVNLKTLLKLFILLICIINAALSEFPLPFASERVPSDNLLLWGIMSLPVYPLPLRSDKAAMKTKLHCATYFLGASFQLLYILWLVA